MPIIQFPDVEKTDADGILAIGGDLHPDSLELAYSQGIFPWPMPSLPLTWFCPPERGILKFEDLTLSRRFRRKLKKSPFRVTINQAFPEVIENCASVKRPDSPIQLDSDWQSWITPEMKDGYLALHKRGKAHSVESWNSKNELVGGIYGVSVGGVFSAESMFYFETDASQIALVHLINHLSSRGLHWIDIQMVTPHLEKMGGRYIPRAEYLTLLRDTQKKKLVLFDSV